MFLGSHTENYYVDQCHKDSPLCFILTVLDITFKALFHFELTLCIVMVSVYFIILLVNIQVLQHQMGQRKLTDGRSEFANKSSPCILYFSVDRDSVSRLFANGTRSTEPLRSALLTSLSRVLLPVPLTPASWDAFQY